MRSGFRYNRPPLQRLLEHVKMHPKFCWQWTGPLPRGRKYPQVKVNGKFVKAHRLMYELAYGPIPPGKGFHGTVVMHLCDNPRCVKPCHLVLGTQADNVADMDAKGRKVVSDRRGEKNPNHRSKKRFA